MCKNDIEFITQEDIEDIPAEDLTHIKFNKAIYCLDKDSFKNMVKFAKDQKVRGACKKRIQGKPADCKFFYPINIGQNVYISEDNYKKILQNDIKKRSFVLKNKRVVDFTTGDHYVSQKSGKDNVYDLVAEPIKKKKLRIMKKVKRTAKKAKKMIGGKKQVKKPKKKSKKKTVKKSKNNKKK